MKNINWNKTLAVMSIAAALAIPTLSQAQTADSDLSTDPVLEVSFQGLDWAGPAPIEIKVIRVNAPPARMFVSADPDGRIRIPIPMPAQQIWAIKATGFLSEAAVKPNAEGSYAVTLQAGDLDNDNMVSVADLRLFAMARNSKPGYPNWNPAADFNKDGIVDEFDFKMLMSNLGKHGTVPTADRTVPYPAIGDIDEDGVIGEIDFKALYLAFNTFEGEKGYDKAADLNHDGAVDIGDYAMLSEAWGQVYPA